MTESEFEQLIGLIPIFIISLIVGVGSFFTQGEPDDDKKTMIKRFFKQIILSVMLCLIVFATLSATSLPYLAKIGISCAVAFFGVEKALSIVQNILNLKNGKGDKWESIENLYIFAGL